MPEITRRPITHEIDPGPYLATVVSHLDPLHMGALRVNLQLPISQTTDLQAGSIIVSYCSPFFGSTSVRYEGNDSSNFNDVQKSYGFWMVPPDIGATVMVMFVNGRINEGFWFGCIPDRYQNHMVPGIASSQYSAMTEAQLRQYGTRNVPVAEFHKSSRDMSVPNPDTFTKPVHPFADRLVQQGLLIDDVRGVTSSSARREAPSNVFGISTPGPVDLTSPRKIAGFMQDGNSISLPVSRLGGHQFVMDDGDKDGKNELFRIRTRTGHQILLHNSSDLIYIANSKGSAWIELSSNGKIDMYAEDSVSIHTMNDFNFLADRDINIEAKRDMNVSVGGTFHLDVKNDYIINVSSDGVLTLGGNLDVNAGSNISMTAAGDQHILASDVFITGSGNVNNTAGGSWAISAGNSNITSGEHRETAGAIHMNGPAAIAASAATAAAQAESLPIYSLPNRLSDSGWANSQFYKADEILTIMKRVPTHEPWDHHENINPQQFSPEVTDLESGGAGASVDYRVPPSVGTPPKPTGNIEQDNIAAMLWTIRVCEGTAGPDGFRTMFTGRLFSITDPNARTYQWRDHPRIVNRGGGYSSSAAGAYQFLTGTWDECKRALRLPNFTPESQDRAAVYLIQRRGALTYVKNGNISRAMRLLNREWASLPGSPYGQPVKTLAQVQSLFRQAGGTLTA